MKNLRFFHQDIAARYGCSMRRIPLNLGFGCPNRKKDGSGGCIFCAENGARVGYLDENMSLKEQIEKGILFAKTQYNSYPPYIAYFQAYTSTNAPTNILRDKIETVLSSETKFPVVIISTRPDCLSDSTISLLQELNKKHEIWVELGVQTSCDKTLEFIHRGHDFQCSIDAVTRLHSAGIHTAAHLILGLPGEDEKTWEQTAEDISNLPFEAIKMHHLQILKNTELANIFRKEPFTVLNEYDYANALTFFLGKMREDILLMRLCAEAPSDSLIAPKWHLDKNQFHEMFIPWFYGDKEHAPFSPQITKDGSWTLYHPIYHQYYHSIHGAATESEKKYIIPCQIEKALKLNQEVKILEIGFGLGFNAAAIVNLANKLGEKTSCCMVSLEIDKSAVSTALSLPKHPNQDMLLALKNKNVYDTEKTHIHIVYGDARVSVRQLKDNDFDFIFLDAFSPESNPELWTFDFLKILLQKMKTSGILATYSTAYPLLGALQELNMCLYMSEPFGRKRPGLLVSKEIQTNLQPFSEKELMIARTCTVGISWKDPTGYANREEICKRREIEKNIARKNGMPKWLKRIK